MASFSLYVFSLQLWLCIESRWAAGYHTVWRCNLGLAFVALVGLYEESEKPHNALSFVQQFMSGDAPGSADIETLKSENAELKAENEALKAENAQLKAGGGDAE